ncbi:MAG: SDR family oxidoreductase [Lachnospiraceae bacterium]|jgi:NAD(P)-dependent dehydrogenase (short-subunit alcohol dehydrogenase family)
MTERKVAIVTGGSSGIGKTTAESLVRAGCRVYEFSRRDIRVEGVTHITADVTDGASVVSAVNSVLDREGKIDILVNCAGFGISGAIEFTDTEDAIRQFDVNFFGTVRCNKAVLRHMRNAGSGRIVNISSVAAPIPIPFQAYYSASKAAINNYSMALANEVRPYGITVCAIQPGDIATGFTDARVKTIAGDEEYGGRISRSVAVMEKDEKNGMSPETVGAYIAGISLRKRVKPLYAVGCVYKLFTVMIKLLPCRFANRVVGLLYAK